jgi:hypothetical protein
MAKPFARVQRHLSQIMVSSSSFRENLHLMNEVPAWQNFKNQNSTINNRHSSIRSGDGMRGAEPKS